LIDRIFDTATRYAAVIPGVEVPDTLKRTSEVDRPAEDRDPLAAILGDDAPGSHKNRKLRIVESTLDRSRVFAIQTPQVFEAALLRKAYEQEDLTSTDDAALVERLLAAHPEKKGGTSSAVVVIDGDIRNIKITRPADVRMARSILGVGASQERPAHKRF
jgi:2-C-methyl-D-erythritol 4-phosphate cytidylyltransferase